MGTGLNGGPAPSGWSFEEGIGGHLARASLQGAWAGGIFPAGSGTKMLAQAFDAGPAAPGLGRRPGGTGPGRAPTDRELEVLGKLAAARRTRRSPKSFLSPFTVKARRPNPGKLGVASRTKAVAGHENRARFPSSASPGHDGTLVLAACRRNATQHVHRWLTR
jgi:hypothetical protein